jgi:hypothetical protein
MATEIFKQRESAFEYEFCHKVDQQLLQRLREELEAEQRRDAMSSAIGIRDEAVLEELDWLNINSEHLLVLSLYPLVHVAWADGSVDRRERNAVLQAAESIGHGRCSASYHLLEHWLDERPTDEMFTAWKDYVTSLLDTLTPVAQRAVRFNLFSNTRKVAEAAGGILGIHKNSAAEEAALDELRNVVGETTENTHATETSDDKCSVDRVAVHS